MSHTTQRAAPFASRFYSQDVIDATTSTDAQAAGATVATTAQGNIIALSRADVSAFLQQVRGSDGAFTAAALAEACARGNIPSRVGRTDASQGMIQQCCASLQSSNCA